MGVPLLRTLSRGRFLRLFWGWLVFRQVDHGRARDLDVGVLGREVDGGGHACCSRRVDGVLVSLPSRRVARALVPVLYGVMAVALAVRRRARGLLCVQVMRAPYGRPGACLYASRLLLAAPIDVYGRAAKTVDC